MTEEAANRVLYAKAEGNGVTGYVAASGKSYLCSDTTTDPLYLAWRQGARSSVTVPLQVGDQVIGTFNVESPQVMASPSKTCNSARSLAGNWRRLCTHWSFCPRRNGQRRRNRSKPSAARWRCPSMKSWLRPRRCWTAGSASSRKWPTGSSKSWPGTARSSSAFTRWAKTWRPGHEPAPKHQDPSQAARAAGAGGRQ